MLKFQAGIFESLRFQAGILLKKNFGPELCLNKNFGPTLKKCRPPPYPPPHDDMYVPRQRVKVIRWMDLFNEFI